jgi:hypothetical protein
MSARSNDRDRTVSSTTHGSDEAFEERPALVRMMKGAPEAKNREGRVSAAC